MISKNLPKTIVDTSKLNIEETCTLLIKEGFTSYETLPKRYKTQLLISFLKAQDSDDQWDIVFGALYDFPKQLIQILQNQLYNPNTIQNLADLENIGRRWKRKLLDYTQTMVAGLFEEQYELICFLKEDEIL